MALIQLHDGKIATPGITRGIPSREFNANLGNAALFGSTGRPGIIEEILAYPRVYAATAEAENLAANAPFEIELPGSPADPVTFAEEAFADEVRRILFEEMTTDIENPGAGGFKRWMADLMAGRWYGHYVGELSWIDGRLEIFNVHQSSIRLWNFEEERQRLQSITQQTDSASVEIEAEKLLHVVYGGAFPVGRSVLRPLAFDFELCKQNKISYANRLAAESGTLIITAPPGTDVGEGRRERERLQEIIIGEDESVPKRMVLTHGTTYDHKYPSGTASDPVGFLQYFDSEVDALLNRSFASLGFSSFGSRAVAETLSADSGEKWVNSLNAMADAAANSRLFPFVASQLGFTGRLPKLRVKAAEQTTDPATKIQMLSTALSTRLINWTEADERELREELGLKAPEDIDAEETAEAVADASPATAVAAPTNIEAELSDCGCAVHLNDRIRAPKVLVQDFNGETFETHRPLIDAEKLVAWKEITDQRQELDSEFETRIAGVAARFRSELSQFLEGERPREDDLLKAEVKRIADSFNRQVRTELDEYGRRARELSSAQGDAERERQLRFGVTTGPGEGVAPDTLRQFTRRQQEMADIQAGNASERIIGRVQAEVLTAWEASPQFRAINFQTQQTPAGLLREGRGLANRGESLGRIFGAVTNPDPGLVVAGVIRTSVRDANRCVVCEARDLIRWDFPQDLAEFLSAPEAVVPDPKCEGRSSRCRCGFIVLWKREEDIVQ